MKNLEYQIRKSICQQLQVDVEQTLKTTRVRRVSEARQMFMLWLRKNTTYTLTQIAHMVRTIPYDHTTVIYSCQAMQDLIDTNKHLRDVWESLEFVNAINFTSLKYKPC